LQHLDEAGRKLQADLVEAEQDVKHAVGAMLASETATLAADIELLMRRAATLQAIRGLSASSTPDVYAMRPVLRQLDLDAGCRAAPLKPDVPRLRASSRFACSRIHSVPLTCLAAVFIPDKPICPFSL
jgi:hypothetical protein